MKFERKSGILCHPTSFPSDYGIGDFGKGAFDFIDFLEKAKQKIWQILPLSPTGYGDSPYQSFSAFAGNHYLISPKKLVEKGLLKKEDIESHPQFPKHKVDYGNIIEWKMAILEKAFENFKQDSGHKEKIKLERFCKDNDYWINDYALFMSLKKHFDGKSWEDWDKDISNYEPQAVKKWTEKLNDSILYQKWLQFTFSEQWQEVKYYANEKNISIIGDLPIFVAYDSADLWSNPDLFIYSYIAGVPPDYFSSTGQLWGNPQYNWEKMKENDYRWWRQRFTKLLDIIDIIRVDHFRGFEASWYVYFDSENAIKGRWVKAPGEHLFDKVYEYMGKLPIIAENLGVITPEVEALRNKYSFPGMRILQFAFDDFSSENGFLPHNYEQNTVVYTGTHDNDTTVGWFHSLNEDVKNYVKEYLNTDANEIQWDIIRAGHSSNADLSIIPMQDIFGLGTDSRMNYPGKDTGNWSWRYEQHMINDDLSNRLKRLTELYGRG